MAGEQAEAASNASPASGDQEQEHQSGEQNGSDTGAEQEGPGGEGEGDSGAEGSEQGAEGAAKTEEKPGKKKDPWWQHRINELSRKAKDTEEQRVREVAALSERLAALESGNGTEGGTETSSIPKAEAERRIQEGVEARFRQQSFNDTCNAVYAEGDKKFDGADGNPTFKEALAGLGMVGEISPSFIEAATAIDNGHEVLYHLGTNPEIAVEMLSLPPVKLAIRMATLAGSLAKPAPKPVSRTSAPIKPISGSGRAEVDLRTASLDDFMSARDRVAPIKR